MSSQRVKIHIGNISAELKETPSDLESRIAKFGTITSRLSLHTKPALKSYFGFVEVDITDQDFNKLCGSLHGYKFKDSILTITKAKKDWKQRWAEDHDNENLQHMRKHDMDKRQKIADRRRERIENVENIDFFNNPPIRGRLREKPRSRNDLKNATFRIETGGLVKTLKGKKQKLWGYDKDKVLTDLAYKYVDGTWRDDNNHVVERLLPLSGDVSKSVEAEGDDQRNLQVLENLLSNYDFDKPMELDDDEPKGMYKMEPQGQSEPVTFEENGKESVVEIEDVEDMESHQVEETNAEEIKGSQPTKQSTTENLRSLFNAPESTGLKLIDSDEEDDIDHSAPVELTEQQQQSIIEAQREHQVLAPVRRREVGLFFPHSDSPFLRVQTQLNKLNTNFGAESFDSWFWEHRGELNREFRRRKRDLQRQMSKKNNRQKFA